MFILDNFNRFKVYLITFISNFILFYSPIIFVFYKNFDVDIFKVGIIFSVTSIATIIFEIPFGIFADRKSPKLSVILGSVMIIFSLACMIFSTNFYQFLICAIFMAIGDAGISGANTVILMSLLERKDEVFEISSISNGFASILGGILIGFVYSINIRLPFFISLILAVINLFLYFSISKKENKEINEKEKESSVNLKGAFLVFKSQIFIFIVLFISYISIPQIAIYFPKYLEVFKVDVKYIGIMYMLSNVISMFGTKFHQRYLKKFDIFLKLKISFLFLAISVFFIYISKNFYVSMFFYSIYRFITGFFYLLFSMYINSKTDLNYKSTILSIKSVVIQFAFIVSDPLVTYILKEFDVTGSYLFSLICILFVLVFVIFYRGKKINLKSQ